MSAVSERARVFRIFSEAMDVAPDSRDGFLRQQCGDNLALLKEVAALLVSAQTDFSATGMLLSAAPEPQPDLSGHDYGRFRLRALIGRGGMGVVYSAVRTDGVPQSVAIKLLRSAISAESTARFIGEARLLARINHAAIARFIDVGVKDGQGWLAIELIRGQPIDEYCKSQKLDIRQQVKLLALIAGAVATAHRSLVVHRDIKPTNVLVDEDGHPKLIDFGIASALGDTEPGRDPTHDVRQLFTPHYAAPEQVRGEPITIATDVFGLGALAYRVLSGCTPYRKAGSAAGYMACVTQEDVEAPSRAAASLNPVLARQLRGDVDAILMKAMDRDPERRYASALEFQSDLHRYLDGLPVKARAPSLGYRFAKFARRRALALALSSVIVAGLLAGAVIYTLQARSVAQARSSAARRGELFEQLLKSPDPNIAGRRDVTVAELLDAAAKQLSAQASSEPLVAASMYELIAQTEDDLGRYPEGLVVSDQAIRLLRAHDGDSVDLANALATQGDLLRNSSRYQDSTAPLLEAARRLSGVRGQEVALANIYNTLGSDYNNMPSHDKEAEAALRKSIEIFNSVNSSEVGYALGDLGAVFNIQGRYQEAEPLLREGIARLLTIQSPDHPDILSFKNTLAGLLTYSHRALEGETLFRQVLESRQRILGPDHPTTHFTAATLADNLLQQRRFADAAAIALPAAKALEREEGADHALTLYAWVSYGMGACQSGEGTAGLAALERAGAGRDKLYGHADWRSVSTRISIGTCLVALKRYKEAEPLLLENVHDLEEARGPAFRSTQGGYRSLRDLYAGLNQLDEASRWAAKILP